ncbi:MAG: class I SAM-dependent methyltransferase [Acidimicrobiales bacterium]
MGWQRRRKALGSLARQLRRPEFRRHWLLAGQRVEGAPRAKPRFVFEACPSLSGRVVPMGDVVFRTFNLDPTERYCLAAMAQVCEPRRIFEFGTYDGATTMLLARAAPQAEVVTLDLPPEALAALTGADTVVLEQIDIAGGTGARFRGQPESSRITQLLDDSLSVDLSRYFGTCGLVLVDGGHSEEIVRADTLNAMRLIEPGGIVVWDDYSEQWPGVTRAVDSITAEMDLEVVRLEPTGLAMCDPTGVVLKARL